MGSMFNLQNNRMWVINTDADSAGGISPHDIWFQSGYAITSSFINDKKGYRKYGELVMGKLKPDDVLIMYANGIGGVGVGSVLELWDRKRYRGNLLIHRPQNDLTEEYRICVDWFSDLRERPISAAEIVNKNNRRPLNATLVEIKNPKMFIPVLKNHNVDID